MEVKIEPGLVPLSYHLDTILEELGNFGKFQIINYIWIVIPIALNAFYTTSYVFTAGSTAHRCAIPECDQSNPEMQPSWLHNAIPSKNGVFESCARFSDNTTNLTMSFLGKKSTDEVCPAKLFDKDVIVNCDSWIYANMNTIVGEFDLACQEWKRTMVGTINNVGQLFTMPLTGFVSDKYGRKIILILGVFGSGILGIIRAFSTNYWMFFFLEFLDPVIGAGVYTSVFILGVELVGPDHRVLGSTIICCFYAIGEVLLGVLAYYFPYWRTLTLIIYVPALLVVSYFWLIPESIRWLISKGKIQQAKDLLTRAAKMNGRDLSNKSLEIIDSSIGCEVASNHDVRNKIHFKDICKSKIIMIRIVVGSFWWITCTFVFYGLSLNSVEVAGNSYLNFILVSLIEIPAYIAYYYTVDKFGRKMSLNISFIGSGIACFAFPFIPEEIYWLRLTFFLLGKFAITLAFTVIYVYTAEIFPTPARHSLLGTCSMFGRIGSIVAPQAPLLSTVYEPLPMFLFGATSVISGVSIFFFPETLHIKLPETIEEAENISQQNKMEQVVK